jgi:hypothetical protein
MEVTPQPRFVDGTAVPPNDIKTGHITDYQVQSQTLGGTPPHKTYHVRRSTLLLIALLLLIIAAAVGGGVGGSVAVKNAKTACLSKLASTGPAGQALGNSVLASSATAAASSGSAKASATASAGLLYLPATTVAWGSVETSVPLPNCNQKTYTSQTYGATFSTSCEMENLGGDILWIVTPAFDLCIEACSAWNKQPAGSVTSINATCAGLIWFPSWTNGRLDNFMTGAPVNCILKYTMAGLAPSSGRYAAVLQV